MSKSEKKPDGTTIVTLEGDLTVQRANELKDLLLKAVQDSKEVFLRFGQVSGVDLTCLQLFCSVHRTAVDMKKTAKLDGPAPSLFIDLARSAGFLQSGGCELAKQSGCCWQQLNKAGASNG
jgi:anti-anti-sigma regulatory factor